MTCQKTKVGVSCGWKWHIWYILSNYKEVKDSEAQAIDIVWNHRLEKTWKIRKHIPHTIHVWFISLHENHKNQPFHVRIFYRSSGWMVWGTWSTTESSSRFSRQLWMSGKLSCFFFLVWPWWGLSWVDLKRKSKPGIYIKTTYPPVIKHSNGKWTLWRYISYSKWGFTIAMLVYWRVIFLGFHHHSKKSPTVGPTVNGPRKNLGI